MAKGPQNISTLGIFISPDEISIAQTKLLGNGKVEPEHLVKLPTGFQVKEGMQRPLSLNNDFFNEKAAWVNTFKTAVKKVGWNT